jgi:hypothetical protein
VFTFNIKKNKKNKRKGTNSVRKNKTKKKKTQKHETPPKKYSARTQHKNHQPTQKTNTKITPKPSKNETP